MRTKKKEKVIDRQEQRIEKTKCRCCKTVTNKPRRPIFLQILSFVRLFLRCAQYRPPIGFATEARFRRRRVPGNILLKPRTRPRFPAGCRERRARIGQQRRPILGDLTFEKVKQPLAKRALVHAGGGLGGWRRALDVERRSKLTASETEELERTRVGRRQREEESETVPAEDTGSNTHKNTCVRARTWCLEIA